MKTQDFTATILVDQTPQQVFDASIMFVVGGLKKLRVTLTNSMMSLLIITRMFISAE
jgi:hypothetical protein